MAKYFTLNTRPNGLITLVIPFLLVAGCSTQYLAKEKPVVDTPAEVKNLILMIGDGMGAQQIGLLEHYARLAPNSVYQTQNRQTGFSQFAQSGRLGLSLTHPADTLVTDSACAATQLATGAPSRNGMIGLDATGNRVETILERAKAQGKSTGLVSDTRITHATPAAFAAHQPSRKLENDIAEEMLTSGNVDVMLSGGLRHWIPETVNSSREAKDALAQLMNEPSIRIKSKRKDDKNLLQMAKNSGYSLAFNLTQLQRAEGEKLLGLFAYSGMLDGIGSTHNSGPQPSLEEMTVKALDTLAENPKGFFLMIEGGQIDWAGHNNDAGSLLHEMLKFDAAIEAVYQWVKDRQDTLVVITADHETGGFGFSYSRKDIPPPFSLSGNAFNGENYYPSFNFGHVNVLDKLYAQSANFPAMWDMARGDQRVATAEAIMLSINAHSAFKIDLAQAEAIVQREINHHRFGDHGYLSHETFPKIDDFEVFYVYGDEIHYNLIGRALAADQNVVWATGTHTATPVPVLTWGPEHVIKNFPALTTHIELAHEMMRH